MDFRIYKEVRKVWKKINNKYYWGSNIDVRYKLIENIHNIKDKLILDVGGAPGVIDFFIEKNNFVINLDISRERLKESSNILNNTKLIMGVLCILWKWKFLPKYILQNFISNIR